MQEDHSMTPDKADVLIASGMWHAAIRSDALSGLVDIDFLEEVKRQTVACIWHFNAILEDREKIVRDDLWDRFKETSRMAVSMVIRSRIGTQTSAQILSAIRGMEETEMFYREGEVEGILASTILDWMQKNVRAESLDERRKTRFFGQARKVINDLVVSRRPSAEIVRAVQRLNMEWADGLPLLSPTEVEEFVGDEIAMVLVRKKATA